MLKAPITRIALLLLLASALVPFGATAAIGSTEPSAPVDTAPSRDEIAAEFPPVADTSRIIPVNGDLAEVVYALGFGDHVVATDLSATYPPEAGDTPKIGYQRTLNTETILAYEPTLVLADDRAGPPEVFDTLRAAGVEVVIITHHVDLRAPTYKVRAIASVLGVPDVGEEIVATFESELASAREVAAIGMAEHGRPIVLALYLRGDRVQYTFGAGSGIDAVIDAAGGIDAGTLLGVEDFAELSTEAIIDLAPDYLLVPTNGLNSVGGIDGLLGIPGIIETPAGADPDHRVLSFETQFLYGLGPRTGQLVAAIAERLHGGVTAGDGATAPDSTLATA